jgi:radical SAM modification target selenobiotic family peptide
LGKRRIFYLGDLTMDTKELKKILAGVGVVGLLAGGGIAVPGSAGASG